MMGGQAGRASDTQRTPSGVCRRVQPGAFRSIVVQHNVDVFISSIARINSRSLEEPLTHLFSSKGMTAAVVPVKEQLRSIGAAFARSRPLLTESIRDVTPPPPIRHPKRAPENDEQFSVIE